MEAGMAEGELMQAQRPTSDALELEWPFLRYPGLS